MDQQQGSAPGPSPVRIIIVKQRGVLDLTASGMAHAALFVLGIVAVCWVLALTR
jgi:hypothetical protein